MENSRRGTRLAALAALAWGSACGGNVVVDGMPDGSGGAGATGTSGVGVTSTSAISVGVTSTSASWMTTSAVTSSSTGVGGGDARSMCADYCELLQGRCGVGLDDCSAGCDELLNMAPACNDLFVPYFECAIDDVGECSFFPTKCERHLGPFSTCAAGSDCAPLACSDGGDRTCRCKGSCRGVEFSAECRPIGPGDVTCSCFVDGLEVFTCDDPPPACDLAHGCCEPIFDRFR
ncbi:hypothetical protein AB3662_29705 [Sorangium cellulosum]|uniref:hypothetical protein n=1 Tax=Sorangium cellulosum TaxID=56 RepID=UPI003D9A7861